MDVTLTVKRSADDRSNPSLVEVLNLRTRYTADGKLKPGKGFDAEVLHLPRIAAEVAKAEARARELGLIDDAENGEST